MGADISTFLLAILSGLTGNLLGNLLNEGIKLLKDIPKQIINKWRTIAFNRISFDPLENPRCKRAIFEKIKSLNLHIKGNEIVISDGFKKPEAIVQNKTYKLDKKSGKRIYVDVADKKIILRVLKTFKKKKNLMILKNYMDSLYSTYNSPSKVMLFFTAENDKWLKPIVRTPRDYSKLKLTDAMNKVIDDVDYFIKNKKEYDDKGYPYRRGYFLYGKSGTGKSTMAEIISNKYGMVIYMLILNAKDMTDSILINLVSSVPPKSVIIIDEIDKQMEALSKNKTASVTVAGLLTALDGPQRLSEGSIVILTSNKYSFLSKKNMKSLLRAGRIDKEVKFDKKVR